MTSVKDKFNYPAMLNLQGKKCVIIGGGSVAARKLATLSKTDAVITVAAPAFSEELLQAAQNCSCTLIRQPYEKSFITDAFLVIAATDSHDINRAITADAPFLCNNITEPELSNFTVPSAIQKGTVTVTVATGGIPAYTRLLKDYLSQKLTPDFADFNTFLFTIRQEVKQIPSTPKQRTMFWRATLTPDIIDLIETGNIADAKEKILDAVNSFRSQSQNSTC